MKQKVVLKKELIYLILYALFMIVLSFVPSSHGLKTFSGLGRYLFLGMIGIMFFHSSLAEQGRGLVRYWRIFVGHIFLLVLAYILINASSSMLVNVLMDRFHLGNLSLQNDVNIVNTTKIVSPMVFIAFFGIIGPFVEEMVFRYTMMNLLKEKLPYQVVILLQALLFACVHVHRLELSEFIQVIPHFMIGIFWGYLYHKTENIWYSTAIHMVTNTVVFILLLISL